MFPLAGVSNWLTDGLVAFTVIIGGLIFVVPQVSLRESITKAKKQSPDQLWNQFMTLNPNVDLTRPTLELVALYQLLDRIQGVREWPVDYELIIQEVMFGLIPVFVAYAIGK